MIYGFFSNLFGKKKDETAEALAEMEAEGILTGAEHIEGIGKVEVIDENTPDHFGSWDPNNFEEYHRRSQEITDAEDKGDAQLKAVLAKYGCADYDEFERIQTTFLKHYAQDPRFFQAQLNLQTNQMQQQLQDAISPELLEPINGVSLEKYATLMAKMTQLGGDAAAGHKLLAENGLDQATFNAADQGWQARMRQAESMGSFGLMTEYGKYFASAGQGQFSGAAGASVGLKAGEVAATGEPCTFEKYCEIGAAQNVWAERGQDVNAMLKSTFDIDATGWSNLSAYWSQKFMSDYTMAEKFTKLTEQYEAQYRGAGGGQDDDLSF